MTAQATRTASTPAGNATRRFESRELRRRLIGARIYPLLVVSFVLLALIESRFATELNLRGLLTTASTNLLVVAGLTLVLVCGEIDLSVGSTLSLSTMIVVGWQGHIGLAGSIVAALVVGALIGLINGVIVAKLGINSLLTTLATMIVVNGIALSFANGGTVSSTAVTASLRIQDPILGFLSITSLVAIAVLVVLQVALSQSRWGRSLYLVGGSEDGGRLAGLRFVGLKTSAFTISGLTAAAGGVVLGIGLNTGSPTFGSATLFTVIAAAVVGGTSLLGAEGGVAKSAAGLLTLTMISNAMTLGGIATFIQTIVNGAILLVVVLLDSYFGVRRRRAWAVRSIERDITQTTPTLEEA